MCASLTEANQTRPVSPVRPSHRLRSNPPRNCDACAATLHAARSASTNFRPTCKIVCSRIYSGRARVACHRCLAIPPARAAGGSAVDRCQPAGRSGHAPAQPAGRTALRAGCTRHGPDRSVAVAAPWQRVVRRKKPPVFMWLQAATYAAIPHWPVAFLLPSLLAALATLWLTWDIARRLWNRRVAAYAVLALFTVLQFGLMAKRAQIDMVLVALTTPVVVGNVAPPLRGPDWRAWTLGLFAAGVGTVTKGVGFLPLLLLLPWMALRRTHVSVLPARAQAGRSWLLVLPAFVAGTAVWLGPLCIALLHSDDPQLHALCTRTVVQADRYALRACLASRQTVLVLPAGDRHVVAARLPVVAVLAASLVAATTARRPTLCAAAGLERVGAAVLQRQPGQARGLHLPDAAGAVHCRGALAGRAVAPARRADAADRVCAAACRRWPGAGRRHCAASALGRKTPQSSAAWSSPRCSGLASG